ncbi:MULTISPECIES: hypothetical protein [Mesorhizobium]|uniref:hypothetical protein n=1 Tax=Mesorhizobium australicum TaxID=536018 RepID=UPI00333B121C
MARLYASNASRFGARNGKSLAYSTSLTERNRLLRALWRKHDRWRDLPTGAAARAMLTAFSRYEAGRWLIDSRALSAPPQEPEATFWRILMAEETLPGSIKQMRRVLEGDG